MKSKLRIVMEVGLNEKLMEENGVTVSDIRKDLILTHPLGVDGLYIMRQADDNTHNIYIDPTKTLYSVTEHMDLSRIH